MVPGVYQLRGSDLSNLTVIKGDSGIIVVNVLTSRKPRPRRCLCAGSTAATARSRRSYTRTVMSIIPAGCAASSIRPRWTEGVLDAPDHSFDIVLPRAAGGSPERNRHIRSAFAGEPIPHLHELRLRGESPGEQRLTLREPR